VSRRSCSALNHAARAFGGQVLPSSGPRSRSGTTIRSELSNFFAARRRNAIETHIHHTNGAALRRGSAG